MELQSLWTWFSKLSLLSAQHEVLQEANSMKIDPSSIGIDQKQLEQEIEKSKLFLNERQKQIDASKKAQNKEKVRQIFLELGDYFFKQGGMFRALEQYRGCRMYSTSNEDLITIGIKIGLCSIYTKDFQFGQKYIKDAI